MRNNIKIKRFVLCADDFGGSIGINQAILNLAGQDRVTAVSCLTNKSYFASHARQLSEMYHCLDIGWQINLTEGPALSGAFISRYGDQLFSFPKLIWMLKNNKLDLEVIRSELMAQLECFIQKMQCLPDFITGHQHVHQLPVILKLAIELYQKYGLSQNKKAYIRWVRLPLCGGWRNCIKQLAINYFLSPTQSKNSLSQHGIPHNDFISGVSFFGQARPHAEQFSLILQDLPHDASVIIFCRPAIMALTTDPIARARVDEYAYLKSQFFLRDCVESACFPSRFLAAEREIQR